MSSLQTFSRPNCQSDTSQSQGRSQDFSLTGPQVERHRRDNRGAEMWGGGVGVPLPTGGLVWGGLCPLPRNFFECLYQNSKFSCILGSN